MMDAPVLDRIAARLEQGSPITPQDAEALAASRDILALGSLADAVRRRRHGPSTTFLRVAELPVGDAAGPPGGWPAAAREIRLAGPFRSVDAAETAVRAAAASGRPVTGFSLREIEAAAAGDVSALREILRSLRRAGLTALAEAPVADLADWRGSFEATIAADLAIPRITVDAPPHGGILAIAPRVADACRLFGVPAFAPLPRQPGAEPTTGYEDVKAVALARILLEVDHIQVDWRLHGPKLAQVALTMGASDVDNVAAHDDAPEGPRRSPLEEILRNIRAAGLEPVERDAGLAPAR